MRRAGSLVLALLLAAACRRGEPSSDAPEAKATPPDQIIASFAMDSYAKGAREWVLESPKAFVYEADKRVDVDRPHIRFYRNEKPGSVVEAGRGRLHTDSRDLEAWNGVVMVSTEGARLESPSMDYKSAQDLVVSTAPVVVTRGSSVIRGVGWEAKPDMSHMVVHHQTVEWSGPDK